MNFPSIPQGHLQILLVILIYLLYTEYQEDRKYISESMSKYEIASNDYLNNSTTLMLDSIYKADELSDIEKEHERITKYVKKVNYKLPTEENISIIAKIDSLKKARTATLKEFVEIKNKIVMMKYNLDYSTRLVEEVKGRNYVWFYFIMTLLIALIIYEIGKEGLRTSKANEIEYYKNRTYRYCQSCARYFSPLLSHGKEKDGTENKGFCNECYNDGEFLNTELKEQDVIENIIKANAIKVNPKKIKSLVNTTRIELKVNRMVRWNKNPYEDSYKF